MNKIYITLLISWLALAGIASAQQVTCTFGRSLESYDLKQFFKTNDGLFGAAMERDSDVNFIAEKLFKTKSTKSGVDKLNDFVTGCFIQQDSEHWVPRPRADESDLPKEVRLSQTETIMLYNMLRNLFDKVIAAKDRYEVQLKLVGAQSMTVGSSPDTTVSSDAAASPQETLASTRENLVKLCGEKAVADFDAQFLKTKSNNEEHH